MNINLFTEKFIGLFDEMEKMPISWTDEVSYFLLHAKLDSMAANCREKQEEEIGSIIASEASSLMNKIEDYKHDLLQLPGLTDKLITRIILINRIEFLFYQQLHKMKDDMDSVHFMLADKLIQGALITGLNGPYHQLYLSELLNYERLVKVVDDFSRTRPFVEKYGRQVQAKQKVQLSQMEEQELLKILEKTLEENPTELLSRAPEYREGFLKKVK